MRRVLPCVVITTLVACDSSQPTPTQTPEPQATTATQPAEQADPLVSIPGTGVSLAPPPGFVAFPGYDGFHNEATMGMIMVAQVDSAYQSIRTTMEAGLAQAGVTVTRAEDLAQGELPGRLLLLSQESAGQPSATWYRVVGNDEKTIIISATCLDEACGTEIDQFEAALRSAVWDPNTPDLVGVQLTDPAGLQPVMQDERELMYSTDGTLAGDMVFRVSLVSGAYDDAERQRALNKFEAVRGFPPEDVKPVTIDGLDGQAFMGKDSNTGVLFFDVVLFDKAGIWYMTGNARKDSPAARETFLRIANSFRRNDAARYSGG